MGASGERKGHSSFQSIQKSHDYTTDSTDTKTHKTSAQDCAKDKYTAAEALLDLYHTSREHIPGQGHDRHAILGTNGRTANREWTVR